MLWLAVAVGGACGAMVRFAVALMLPIQNGEFPWATFLVNVVGSFLAGILYVLIVEKGVLMPQLRPALMFGMLGALTTFSTFSLEGVLLVRDGYIQLALGYLSGSFFCCIAAAFAGLSITSKII